MRVDSHRFTLRKTVRVDSNRHSVTKTPCEHPRTVFLLREPRSSVVMRGLRNGKTVRVSSHSFALTKICVRGQGQGSSSYIGPSASRGDVHRKKRTDDVHSGALWLVYCICVWFDD